MVAARAYRLAARKRAAASSEATTPLAREHTLHELPLAEASSSGSGSGSSTTFTRLAKLLHQSSALAGRSNLQPVPPPGDNAARSLGLGLGLGEEAPRRLSWERCVYVIYNISSCPCPEPFAFAFVSALSTFTLTDWWTGGWLLQLANFICAPKLENRSRSCVRHLANGWPHEVGRGPVADGGWGR